MWLGETHAANGTHWFISSVIVVTLRPGQLDKNLIDSSKWTFSPLFAISNCLDLDQFVPRKQLREHWKYLSVMSWRHWVGSELLKSAVRVPFFPLKATSVWSVMSGSITRICCHCPSWAFCWGMLTAPVKGTPWQSEIVNVLLWTHQSLLH